ncbi:MAG: hypothetical protein AB1861_22510 [Cyanobacteriota bacterium]
MEYWIDLDLDKTRSLLARYAIAVLALLSSLMTCSFPVTHAFENFYLIRAEDFAG